MVILKTYEVFKYDQKSMIYDKMGLYERTFTREELENKGLAFICNIDDLEVWGKGDLRVALYRLGDKKYRQRIVYFVEKSAVKDSGN